MPNYKLRLEYNGENFFGSQKQNHQNQEIKRTVQAELESVLRDCFGEEVSTVFAGRTDRGVHAIGQIVSFQAPRAFDASLSKSIMRLNSHLPEDMAVTKLEEADDKFNARFDAKSREYLYKLFIRRQRPVLRLDSLAWFKEELDFDLMQKHCQSFIGKKDFSAYSKDEEEPEYEEGKFQVERTSICEVYEAELIKESKICYKFRIKADRFLRHMVRRMVGELVHIGKGLAPDDKSKNHSVPASGLTLMKVGYD